MVATSRNPSPFLSWWLEVNRSLALVQQPEATFGEARGAWEQFKRPSAHGGAAQIYRERFFAREVQLSMVPLLDEALLHAHH